MSRHSEDRWRIPWPDRFGEWWQRQFPRLGPWMAEFESGFAADHCDLQRVDRPVFIGGLARSGSTMLLEWLNAMPGFTAHRYSDYPLLWTPYWWNLLLARLPQQRVEPVERAHRDRIRVTRDSPEAFEEPIWSHYFPDDAMAASDVLGADAVHPAFERQFKAHLAKLVFARGARRYVGKGNYNTARIGYLARLFPDASFIVPVRRPLAQVASSLKQDRLYADAPARTLRHIAARGHHEFGPRQRPIRIDPAQTAAAAAARREGCLADAWLLQWMAVYGHVERLLADPGLAPRICIVPYEALCADPMAGLARVLEFIGPDAADQALASRLTREQWAPKFVAADGAPLAAGEVNAATLQGAEALHARLAETFLS
ncbi:MAG: sulfotransferase [Rhodanobacteraceae bacterium]|nr:sulfotransferase [Rhodanobacteraceae bacterium]MBL0042312.1 sulfotransferase [Xanthomonadales bacterium]